MTVRATQSGMTRCLLRNLCNKPCSANTGVDPQNLNLHHETGSNSGAQLNLNSSAPPNIGFEIRSGIPATNCLQIDAAQSFVFEEKIQMLSKYGWQSSDVSCDTRWRIAEEDNSSDEHFSSSVTEFCPFWKTILIDLTNNPTTLLRPI